MAGMRGREIDRGANLVGAHRDDLILHLGDLPAKGFASHGEQWSLALALRLASYEMLRRDERGKLFIPILDGMCEWGDKNRI